MKYLYLIFILIIICSCENNNTKTKNTNNNIEKSNLSNTDKEDSIQNKIFEYIKFNKENPKTPIYIEETTQKIKDFISKYPNNKNVHYFDSILDYYNKYNLQNRNLKNQQSNINSSFSSQDFINEKLTLLNDYILNNNVNINQFESESKKLTYEMIKRNKNKLTDWLGTIQMVNQINNLKNKPLQVTVNILDKEFELKNNTDKKCQYSITIVQEQSSKYGSKFLYDNNPNYYTFLRANENDNIIFTAKIIKAVDKFAIDKVYGNYIIETAIYVDFEKVKINN